MADHTDSDYSLTYHARQGTMLIPLRIYCTSGIFNIKSVSSFCFPAPLYVSICHSFCGGHPVNACFRLLLHIPLICRHRKRFIRFDLIHPHFFKLYGEKLLNCQCSGHILLQLSALLRFALVLPFSHLLELDPAEWEFNLIRSCRTLPTSALF